MIDFCSVESDEPQCDISYIYVTVPRSFSPHVPLCPQYPFHFLSSCHTYFIKLSFPSFLPHLNSFSPAMAPFLCDLYICVYTCPYVYTCTLKSRFHRREKTWHCLSESLNILTSSSIPLPPNVIERGGGIMLLLPSLIWFLCGSLNLCLRVPYSFCSYCW